MIFDHMDHLANYKHIPYLKDMTRFLGREDVMDLNQPEIPILGEKLFVRVIKLSPKPASENKFETHRKHADIQVVLKGTELMQVARPQDLTKVTEYDSKGDYQFFQSPHSVCDVVVHPKQFVIFMPGEPHKPGCRWNDQAGEIYKLVFKIRIE